MAYKWYVKRDMVQGILNGIDTDLWDPETDSILPAPYNSERLEGKALCKRFLFSSLTLLLPSHRCLGTELGVKLCKDPLFVCKSILISSYGSSCPCIRACDYCSLKQRLLMLQISAESITNA